MEKLRRVLRIVDIYMELYMENIGIIVFCLAFFGTRRIFRRFFGFFQLWPLFFYFGYPLIDRFTFVLFSHFSFSNTSNPKHPPHLFPSAIPHNPHSFPSLNFPQPNISYSYPLPFLHSSLFLLSYSV